MKRYRGLTLIEMIITISVMAVFTAVAVLAYVSIVQTQRSKRFERDMYQLVDFASAYSLRRWKPTYIHLINIPLKPPQMVLGA